MRPETIGRIVLELAIDLVGEEPRSPLGADIDHTVQHLPRHQHPRRVVRAVDVDELRVRPQRAPEVIEVVRPAVARRAPPLGHRRPGRARDLVRRLVAGRLDDDVIPRLEERVVGDEDPFLRRCDDDDLVRRPGFRRRERSRPGARVRQPTRCSRAAAPRSRSSASGSRASRSAVVERFGVARREHVRRRELVDGIVLLDPKRRDPHACTLRGPRRQALRDDRLGLAVRRGEDVATAQ